jgi:hypothetical protein
VKLDSVVIKTASPMGFMDGSQTMTNPKDERAPSKMTVEMESQKKIIGHVLVNKKGT